MFVLLPSFTHLLELKTAKLLGKGGFCNVYEVAELQLSSEDAALAEAQEIEEFHTRKYMSMTCLRNHESRYAIKRLSEKSLADESLYWKGIADLSTEASFLAVIKHPNIIKARAFALGEFCSDGFFIMMDRLYDTLETTINKWRGEVQKYSSLRGRMQGGKEKTEELFIDRLQFAWDLSNAMAHLHAMK